MTTGSSYNVRPDAVRGVVGNVVGILLQAYSTVMELEQLTVAPTSFAKLGSPVASANITMQGQVVGTMRTLLQVLQEVNDLVHRSANDYDDADRAVAAALGGSPAGTGASTGAEPGAALAGYAINDSAGTAGEPGSVGNVLDYLGRAGLGELSARPLTDVTFHDARDFADWLDRSPANQERVGLLAVYAGSGRDVSGLVHPGDVVVVQPFTGDGGPVIGVAGANGQLYNHGAVGSAAEFGRVRVYRPMTDATALW
ncbi:WXG100 family type VII secretion target [Micromonospora sp. NBC_01412]|uniref:WXG100 family type VII secretion target n=1 Tax=Micromonospora sp. NBC_01412 TaxID=2903590 RepID=UPI00324337CB